MQTFHKNREKDFHFYEYCVLLTTKQQSTLFDKNHNALYPCTWLIVLKLLTWAIQLCPIIIGNITHHFRLKCFVLLEQR